MFLICAYDRLRHLATGGCLYVCFSTARPTSIGYMILGWPSEHLEIDDLEVGSWTLGAGTWGAGNGEMEEGGAGREDLEIDDLEVGSWRWGAGNEEPDCSVTTDSPESPDIFILGPNHLSDHL